MSIQKTIDMTPSRSDYEFMLQTIINQSPIADDVAWSRGELRKLRIADAKACRLAGITL